MAFQTTSITFAENLGTEVIDILVGPEKKHYVVHKKPLTSQSEYFHNAFKGDFKEARENSIHLEEDDPAAVALLIGWIYRGFIPGTEKKISPFAQSSSISQIPEKTTIPLAESINGSQYPFIPTAISDPNSHAGNRDYFQHIGCQPQYQMFSQEELRLADYSVGRRYVDSVTAQSHGFGGFGGAVYRSNNQYPLPHTGGLFGSLPQHQQPLAAIPMPPPPPPPQAVGATGPGPAQPPPVPPSTVQSSNIFNTLQPPPASTANPTPGQSAAVPITQSASSSSPPSSASATSGRFGPTITSTTNQPPATPSAPSASSSSTSAPISAGSSLFSRPASQISLTGPSPNSGLFNDPVSTSSQTQPHQSSNIFAGLGSSSSQAPSQSTGSLFGNLGSLQQVQPQSSVFGAGGLFGAPRPLSQTQTQHTLPGLFGASPAIQSGSLWASTWTPATADDTAPSFLKPGSFGYSALIEHPKSPEVYIPGIPRCSPLGAQNEEQQGHQDALLHLCILAERILWPSLYNAAIEAYVRGELNLHRSIPFEHVDLIYDRTYSESTLRQYVLESMCTNRGDSLMYVELTKRHDDLMEDILEKLPTLRAPKQSAPWSQDELVRSFHMATFGNGKGTASKDVDISGVFPKKEDSDSRI